MHPMNSASAPGTTQPSSELESGNQRTSKGRILAWASWDWGSAAFNAVMTTFVFTVYLTSNAFGGEDQASAVLGGALAVAGLAIALLAPVTGQRSDAGGRRKLWLGVNTGAVALLTALCFFVFPRPEFLLLGVSLIALGNVFFEFAGVNYNAMLAQISTPRNIGKVSGFGWGAGYLGGIVALLIVLQLFVQPSFDWFGAYPVVQQAAKDCTHCGHDVAENGKENNLGQLKAKGSRSDDPAESKNGGQPVPEDSTGQQEVDGVGAGGVDGLDPPDKQAVAGQEAQPLRLGGAGKLGHGEQHGKGENKEPQG